MKALKNKQVKQFQKQKEVLTELNFPNGKFRLVKGLKTDGKEVEGGSDGKLCCSDKERCKVLRDYMEWIMNEENDWDHDVEGPVVCISREEVLQALIEMKMGRKKPCTFRCVIGVDCCWRGSRNSSDG